MSIVVASAYRVEFQSWSLYCSAQASLWARCLSVRSDFLSGVPDLNPASLIRLCNILREQTTSSLFNRCWSWSKDSLLWASTTLVIFSSYFVVVARERPGLLISSTLPVSLYLFSHFLTVLVEQWRYFATAPLFIFGPNGWVLKKTISHHFLIVLVILKIKFQLWVFEKNKQPRGAM